MNFDEGPVIESFILSLYLIFIFLSIQIWFLWRDIDKSELNLKTFFTDSFFVRNCIYVYSFTVFFTIHGFYNGTTVPEAYLETLEMLTLSGLVLLSYDWYSALEPCKSRKSLPQELAGFNCASKKA